MKLDQASTHLKEYLRYNHFKPKADPILFTKKFLKSYNIDIKELAELGEFARKNYNVNLNSDSDLFHWL